MVKQVFSSSLQACTTSQSSGASRLCATSCALQRECGCLGNGQTDTLSSDKLSVLRPPPAALHVAGREVPAKAQPMTAFSSGASASETHRTGRTHTSLQPHRARRNTACYRAHQRRKRDRVEAHWADMPYPDTPYPSAAPCPAAHIRFSAVNLARSDAGCVRWLCEQRVKAKMNGNTSAEHHRNVVHCPSSSAPHAGRACLKARPMHPRATLTVAATRGIAAVAAGDAHARPTVRGQHRGNRKGCVRSRRSILCRQRGCWVTTDVPVSATLT